MSGIPNIRGTNQLENPPIIKGIIIKKIIRNAWYVIRRLKIPDPIKSEVNDNSIRINILILNPIKPDQAPNTKYSVPISL